MQSSFGVEAAVDAIRSLQIASGKPLATVLAGHNGSGKTTMWQKRLSDSLQVPLINADRLMSSVLPEPLPGGQLPEWATRLRNTDARWMKLAQEGTRSFMSHAMQAQVPFAVETVFSDWRREPNGVVRSKLDLVREMQYAGYFVLLLFVGLSSSDLSIARVQTRVSAHGHDVPLDKLVSRFPRTQQAVQQALAVVDAAVLTDNSLGFDEAFSVVRVQAKQNIEYDVRETGQVSPAIVEWLDRVAPVSS